LANPNNFHTLFLILRFYLYHIIFTPTEGVNMQHRFRNPHPFDMSNYYSGLTCVVGGRDFDREEYDEQEREEKEKEKHDYDLDWSFLKSLQIRRYNKRT
jgi:hypothetical protein